MRIRNRRVRLPLSALLPTPLSDLQIRSSVDFPLRVTDGRVSGPHDLNLYRRSEEESREDTDAMGSGSGRRNFSVLGEMEEIYEEVLRGEGTRGRGESRMEGVEIARTSNNAPWIPSKEGGGYKSGVRTGEQTSIQILAMPSRSLQAAGEGTTAPRRRKRAIRRVDQEASESVGSHVHGKVGSISSGKKRLREDMFDQAGDDYERGKEGRVSGAMTPEKKRLKNSSTMPPSGGSRCSRMNGRGWRCCQQTLVGYSLCEHHLGKGRLMKSMARVASRGEGLRSPNLTVPSSTLKIGDTGARDPTGSNPMPPILRKKRERIGAVKARSLKSLLGLTDNTKVAPMAEKSDSL